jgi:WD40-like Beta Propeller Repeat
MRRAMVLVLILATIGCNPTPDASAPTTPLTLGQPPVTLSFGPRVEISPGTALLTDLGETRKLTAQAFDASGGTVAGSPTWTSSSPESVTVGADGTITAVAFGSAQVVAEVGGVKSVPAMVIVATPAAGATLVTDEQVKELAAVDEDSYEATFEGLTPVIGDLLVGTGEEPIAGKVRLVDGAKVTIDLVPLPELFPSLSIEETIDLSSAPVQVRAEIAALYDIVRDGDTFTFTPKPDFMDLLPKTSVAEDFQLVGYREGPAAGGANPAAAAPTGTYMLPFEECETLLTGATANTFPLQLAEPPSFTMAISPSLDIAWTPQDELVRWLIRAEPKATLNAGIKLNAQVEGKIECKATFFEYRIPIGGPLSWFLSGLVPVGLGFALDGKILLASATIGGKVEASTTTTLGIACAIVCGLVHEMGEVKLVPTWTFAAPSVANIRIQPSFEAYGFVKAKVGNPIFTELGIDMAQAKMGGTFGADWAPRVSQIADKAYSSEYKLTLEAGVSAGKRLGELAARLGIDSITALGLKISKDINHSPTAKVSLDKSSYAAGETVVATITFDPPENLRILELAYNVDRVVIVADTSAGGSPGSEELASGTATDGQASFTLSFTASRALRGADLHAFVIPKFLAPHDELALELGKSSSAGRIAFASNRDGDTGLFVIDPGGSDPERKATIAVPVINELSGLSVSADGRTMAWCAFSDLHVTSVTGGSDRIVRRCLFDRWQMSPDATRLAFTDTPPGTNDPAHLFVVSIDGSGARQLTPGGGKTAEGSPAWSADGSKLAFGHSTVDAEGVVVPAQSGIYVMSATRGPMTRIVLPQASVAGKAFSPDGSQLAYVDQSPARDGVGIYVTPITGGIPRFLTIGMYPTWSLDGTKIAFMNANDIWIVNVDGTNLVNLTNSAAIDLWPTFIKD